MKHLTTYKIFESKNEIISTLRDIALDIEDDSFDVMVRSHDSPYVEYPMKLTILKNKLASFDVKEIYNCVKRMVDYMNSEGYISYIQIGRKNSRLRNIDTTEDLLNVNYSIRYLDMGFKNKKK